MKWEASAGTGRLISWVVYHHAPHEFFRERVPYTVAIIELDEGPRLISTLTGRQPTMDAPVILRPEQVGGITVTSFEISRDEHPNGDDDAT
ncbi:Zn-ribbon domain-containing OB-fold protein [Mycobacterium sp. MS1601]|uniref:Zn-ribbon domain-containing OB-fold protein n=1 Tax=Mycobacterium sp. MS1601 TaxID=1936029 RepID=UPI001F194F98|nr:OB-fold domain-containing protein [Mycobacterium sp. MS1601]